MLTHFLVNCANLLEDTLSHFSIADELLGKCLGQTHFYGGNCFFAFVWISSKPFFGGVNRTHEF